MIYLVMATKNLTSISSKNIKKNLMTENTSYQSAIIWSAFILGISLVVCILLGISAVYHIRGLDDTIATTGSAKVAVRSDAVRWVLSFQENTKKSELQDGYSKLAIDLAVIKNLLISNKLAVNKIEVSSIAMNEVWKNYDVDPQDKEYNLSQTITITHSDVDLITNLSKQVDSLIAEGIIITQNYLSYTYSDLASQRVSLLSAAVADARARAEQLALDSGKTVGKIKSASAGVVQVLSTGSTDISDYGSYDTSSIEKEIMVTAKVSFFLK